MIIISTGMAFYSAIVSLLPYAPAALFIEKFHSDVRIIIHSCSRCSLVSVLFLMNLVLPAVKILFFFSFLVGW